MSKQQSTRRCWRCGPVSLSHRCESDPPRHRMRSQPVAGLSTGPQWDASAWAAHYARGKWEVEARVGEPRIGDVYSHVHGTPESGWDRFEIVGRDSEKKYYEWHCRLSLPNTVWPSFASTEWIQKSCRLISGPSQPAKEPRLKVGDVCIVKQPNNGEWHLRRCTIRDVKSDGIRWPYLVRRDDGPEGMLAASELELVKAAQ